jgi:hypothetical protein
VGHLRSTVFKVSKPLALPTSKHTVRCYATHGKGYAHLPPCHTDIDVLLLAAADGELRWVLAHYYERHTWLCPEYAGRREWLGLGWRTIDGSLPLGELDTVDPALAQVQFLGNPFKAAVPAHERPLWPVGYFIPMR